MMKGCLLDANVLIALAWPNHTHHAAAQAWFGREQANGWGTCLVTQLAFVRVSAHTALEYHVSPPEACRKLNEIISLPNHSFWSEPPDGYANPAFVRTIPDTLMHQMVTDGYLATLAAVHGGKLVTFDRQLARIFRQVVLIQGE
jgi:toxin-antitoxin system PIN domain toxin